MLLFFGIANYVHVTVTSAAVRRKELAVLESIGMTASQIRKMLILEGLHFCLITTGLVITSRKRSLVCFWKDYERKDSLFSVSLPMRGAAAVFRSPVSALCFDTAGRLEKIRQRVCSRPAETIYGLIRDLSGDEPRQRQDCS